jgi:hypothetical protein
MDDQLVGSLPPFFPPSYCTCSGTVPSGEASYSFCILKYLAGVIY